jgi:hypothetical protein
MRAGDVEVVQIGTGGDTFHAPARAGDTPCTKHLGLCTCRSPSTWVPPEVVSPRPLPRPGAR